jgi:hypothetical protein
LNAQLRDNMLETAPAKSTGGSWPQHFVVSATNTIAAREIRNDSVDTQQTTTSTSYTDLATVGPAVTLTQGGFVLVFPVVALVNSAAQLSRASFEVTGAGASAANDGRGPTNQGTNDVRAAGAQLLSLSSGSSTFTMKYRVTGGTGTFEFRRIVGMAL